MTTSNHTSFKLRVNIRVPVQTIYDCWISQAGLEKWFLREAKFYRPDESVRKPTESIEAGDSYAWLWHGWGDETRETGKIISLNHQNFLQFSFGEAGIVSISILEEENESVLELVQDQIPDSDKALLNFFVGCQVGWTFYLANLKSILEGGLDLRNRNTRLTRVITS